MEHILPVVSEPGASGHLTPQPTDAAGAELQKELRRMSQSLQALSRELDGGDEIEMDDELQVELEKSLSRAQGAFRKTAAAAAAAATGGGSTGEADAQAEARAEAVASRPSSATSTVGTLSPLQCAAFNIMDALAGAR